MVNRENVLEGLNCHCLCFCFACPYNDNTISTVNCKHNLVSDAIDVIKHDQEIIESLQHTISELTKSIAE